nr:MULTISPECIES: SufS family cysteine desulfurase [unclassified Streptomyces]
MDPAAVRADFPLLVALDASSQPLVYLDSAATSQKPAIVIDAERDFNRLHNANVHRAYHRLSREATELFDRSREVVAAFIGARAEEVVFTKNSSEALNLVAQCLANASRTERPYRSLALGPGDVVVITEMEHHSNLMPWQDLCRRTGAELRWLTITPDGRLDLSELERTVCPNTKVLAFAHQSNLYGTINPVDILVARARQVGALTVLDACQSVPHYPVDVKTLGVDFLAFSGHKACGPTGIGVLWGRADLLRLLPPFMTGGEVNEIVTMNRSTYADPPSRFEAGTPPIAQAIGLAAACGYLRDTGMARVAEHEHALTVRALERMLEVPGLRIVGPPDAVDRGPAIAFAIDNMFPDNIGEELDKRDIGIRAGHMCARPACVRFGLPATTRASFHLYTSTDDVDRLVEALHEIAPRPVAAAGLTLQPSQAKEATGAMTVDDATAFQQRVILDAATAVTALSVSLGDRLGLYRMMSAAGPLTPRELARRTATAEVYIREWLHAQVGAGYIEHHEDTDRFLLSDAHAAVLASSDTPTSGVGIYQVLQSLFRREEELLRAFRSGQGIGWDAHDPTLYPGIGRFFRPKYTANIVRTWLPALDGVVDRLTAGATVADVGCGVGYSTLLMAEAFPQSMFFGTDYHLGSIERARILAEERGLDHRVRFEVAAADSVPATAGGYDLVTYFDCLHDMGDPLAAARRVREVLADDGTWMLVEPNGKPLPSQNTSAPGRLFMAVSPVLCLPSALEQAGPYALGNHSGENALREIITEAGFTGWRLAAETPANAVYEVR